MPGRNSVLKYRITIRWSAEISMSRAAGIHADGLLKNEEIYNCFDTANLLKRRSRLPLPIRVEPRH